MLEILDEIECPARQLVDDRWVLLPTVLAGRVFTHRLGGDEGGHDILTRDPNLDPITALCERQQYGRFADGSAARVVLAEFDDELLEQRGIPAEVVDPLGTLVLAPGTLGTLGVAEGDLVGVRLTEQGLVVERVTAPSLGAHAPVGARLAAMLDAEEPVYFDVAVWTGARVEDPAVFTEPLPPLCEIVDDYGLAHRGEWLAPDGFPSCPSAFSSAGRSAGRANSPRPRRRVRAVHIGQTVRPDVAARRSPPPPPTSRGGCIDRSCRGRDGAHGADSEADWFGDLVGELGAELADPLLAELLVAETIGTGPHGAPALGLFAEVLEPEASPRAARVACRWLRAVALERIGDI